MIDRRQLMRGAATGAALAAMGGFAHAAETAEWQAVVAAAKKEGSLLIITPSTAQAYRDVVKAFEAKYGIRTEMLTARPSEVRARVQVAKAAGNFVGDVMFTSYSQVTLFDKEDNTIAPVPEVPSAGRVRQALRNDAQMVPMTTIPYGILVNTNLVKPEDEPKSWADLADPKWKDKIMLDNPFSSGGGYLWFYMMHDHLGLDFCKKMAAQNMVITQESRESQRRTARGEKPIYIPLTLPDFMQLKGLPIKAVLATEGAPFVPYGNCMLAAVRHPNAARLFLEFTLSDEAQLIYASAGYGVAIEEIANKVPDDVRWITEVKLLGSVTPWREKEMVALARSVFNQ